MMILDIIFDCMETMRMINVRKLANVCHIINSFAVSIIVILAYIQEGKESKKILFPLFDESSENIIKLIFFDLHFLFILITHICHVHKQYEKDEPMLRQKYIMFLHQCLAMVTTCYFFSLIYLVFKWGEMFQCNFLLTKLDKIFIAYYIYRNVMVVRIPVQPPRNE